MIALRTNRSVKAVAVNHRRHVDSGQMERSDGEQALPAAVRNRLRNELDPLPDVGHMVPRLMTCLAGAEAGAVRFDRRPKDGMMAGDQTAEFLAGPLFEAAAECEAFPEWVRVRTRQALTQPPVWVAVRRLAAALSAQEPDADGNRVLTGAEARRHYQEAMTNPAEIAAAAWILTR